MQKHRALSVAILVAVACHTAAQNTGVRATPQTQGSAPAASASGKDIQPSSSDTGKSRPAVIAPSSAQSRSRGETRRGGGAARGQTPAANASVGVLGDANGDGLLDRSGKESAALPGVPMLHNALGIAPGTAISVRLQQAVNSGNAHNGDTVRGVLAAPVGRLPSGAPVSLTVVASAPAGQLGSSGILSLQVVSINGEQVLSQVVTAEGKPGPTILADDAPARGTEAVFSADQPITLPAA